MQIDNTVTIMWTIFFADITIEFDPVSYGPILEGDQQLIQFRIVALTPPLSEVTVLFSTADGTAIGK